MLLTESKSVVQYQILNTSLTFNRIVICLIFNPHPERPLLPWQHWRQEAPSNSSNQSALLGLNLWMHLSVYVRVTLG